MEPTGSTVKVKSTKRWLFPVAMILLLVAIGVGVWMVASNSAQQHAEETPTASVTITDNGFSPATIKVKKGQDITWTNQTSVAKQLAGDDNKPEGFKTGEALGKNDTYSFTFDDAGTYSYHDPSNLAHGGTVIVE